MFNVWCSKEDVVMPRTGNGSIISFGNITVSSESANLDEVRRILDDIIHKHGYPTQQGPTKNTIIQEPPFDEAKERAELKALMNKPLDEIEHFTEEKKEAEPWKR